MKQVMERKRRCRTCASFITLYMKGRISYLEISRGICKLQAKETRTPNFCRADGVCKHWENAAAIVKDREESIRNGLMQMHKKLREIAQILKDDQSLGKDLERLPDTGRNHCADTK